ncbi:MAG: glutaredoxin family protein [Methanobacteriota archaeon]
MNVVHVSGKEKAKIMLYALSTCVWCKKTKQLLGKLGVAYDYVDVDLLEGDEKDRVVKEIERWNPQCSYPTLVINNSRCIVGFKEDEIRDVLHA